MSARVREERERERGKQRPPREEKRREEEGGEEKRGLLASFEASVGMQNGRWPGPKRATEQWVRARHALPTREYTEFLQFPL